MQETIVLVINASEKTNMKAIVKTFNDILDSELIDEQEQQVEDGYVISWTWFAPTHAGWFTPQGG